MKRLSDKLRIIYVPFLLITVGFILVYTLLHWLLFIKAGIPLKEDIVRFWLPFGLPIIPILIWLRPRLKLLRFKNDNASSAFYFFALIAIAIPTIIAQEYLVTATGKKTQLNDIAEFSRVEKTRYYSLKDYFVDKQHIAIHNTATVTGRRNEDFNMLIYIVMPILENNADTIKTEHSYWLGKKYSKRISNGLSDEEKDDNYKAFAEKSQKEFDETDFNQFTYLEVIGNTEGHDEYNTALKKLKQKQPDQTIIFEAKTEPFEARNGKKLYWMLGSLVIGLFVYFIFLLFLKFQENKLKQFKNGKTTKDTDLKEMFDLFVPKKDFFITQLL